MDTIFISELRIDTLIGVHEWETRAPQTIQLDVEVGLPAASAKRSSELRDTIDYAAIVTRIERLFSEERFPLLENAAEAVAGAIRQDFRAPWVRVAIAKLAPLRNVKRLGVVIERGTRPSTRENGKS
jgi:dihydroneopterin aldolase